MNVKDISTLVTGIVVATVIVATVLVPIISVGLDSSRTLLNNTDNLRYSELFEGSDNIDHLSVKLYVEDNTDNTLVKTINGVESTFEVARYQGTLLMCDKMNIRWDPGNGNVRISSVTINGTVSQNNLTAPYTVTVENGIVTFTDSSVEPVTYSVEPDDWLFVPDPNGDYETVLQSTTDVYINSLDDVYFSTSVDTNDYGFVWGNAGEYSRLGGYTSTFGFENMSLFEDYINVYRVNMGDFRFGGDMPDNSDGTPIIPFQLIVPRTVVGYTEPMGIVLTTILSSIPIFVVIGLLSSIIVVRNWRT